MKIAVFGGSFDPVHLGHVSLAEQAVRSGAADRVIFVPAAHQPFKLDRRPADGTDRLRMIELAIAGKKGLLVSDYEIARPAEISYTFLTMRAMHAHCGSEHALSFLLGADSFLKIHTWKQADEMLRSYSLIVGVRPGFPEAELTAQERFLKERYGTEIRMLHNPLIGISSTEIRAALGGDAKSRCASEEAGGGKDEKGAACFVPQKVREYITAHGIYGSGKKRSDHGTD